MKIKFLLLLLVFFNMPFFAMQEITIQRGSTATQIVKQLKKDGIIRFERPFYWYLRLTGATQNLRAGAFVVDPSYSYKKLSRVLQEKEGAASLTKVTVPEGYSIIELADELKKQGLIADSSAYAQYLEKTAKSDLANEFSFLHEYSQDTIEGYLFPNTYIFAKGLTHKEITRTFLAEFQRQVMPLIKKSAGPKLSLHQVITLASIVEREAQVKTEAPQIAGVFHNRLKKGIPLAACPTVGYAIGNPRKKVITFNDLKNPSPYNTYKYQGLPPTAIANPGLSSIKATLNPDETPYLYFVATGTGTHIFSKTYKEHLAHQRRILNSRR